MDFKEYKNKLVSWYNNCTKQQKTLINILVIVCLTSIFYNSIVKRLQNINKLLKQELSILDNRLNNLQAQFVDLDKEKKEIVVYQGHIQALSERLKNLEKGFPTQATTPKLLAVLIENGQKTIDFVSIVPKQKQNKNKDLYTSLDIEMVIRSNYTDITNYIYRLEKFASFLAISNINLEKKESENSLEEYIEARLALSTLLTEEERQYKPKTIITDILKEPIVSKDPFISKTKVKEKTDITAALKLNGVIIRDEKSCAIINDVVYKVGDKVADKVILEIFKDKVILEQEGNEYVLNLENQ